MPGGNTTDSTYSCGYGEKNVDRLNSNEVKLRIIHTPATYSAQHDIFLDYVEISSIEVTFPIDCVF